jgi:hypothetical protein
MWGLRSGWVAVFLFGVALAALGIIFVVRGDSGGVEHSLVEEIQETVYYESFVELYDDFEIEIVFPDSCDSVHHDDFLEIAALADGAGFPGVELHTAVAVAYAESNGKPAAVGKNRNGSKDSGLWQINSVHGFSNLKDPEVNAGAAFYVWEKQGWSAWYAHTPRGGEYGSGKRFLQWLEESECSINHYRERKE